MSGPGVISAERWRENWRAVSDGATLQLELPRSRAGRRARLASIQAPGNSDPRRTDKSGPSPAMLATFYLGILPTRVIDYALQSIQTIF